MHSAMNHQASSKRLSINTQNHFRELSFQLATHLGITRSAVPTGSGTTVDLVPRGGTCGTSKKGQRDRFKEGKRLDWTCSQESCTVESTIFSLGTLRYLISYFRDRHNVTLWDISAPRCIPFSAREFWIASDSFAGEVGIWYIAWQQGGGWGGVGVGRDLLHVAVQGAN